MADDAGAQVAMMRKMMGNKTCNGAIMGFVQAAQPKKNLTEEQRIGNLVSTKVGNYAVEQKMVFNDYLDACMGGALDDGVTYEQIEAMSDKEVYDMMMSHFGEER